MSGTPGTVSLSTVCTRLLQHAEPRDRAPGTAGSCRERRLSGWRRAQSRTNALQRLLVGVVRRGPGRMHLGLAHGLDHRALRPARRKLPSASGSSCIGAGQFRRPGAEQKLVKQIFVVAVGRRRALDVAAPRAQDPAPGLDLPRPIPPGISESTRAGRACPRRAWCRGSRCRAWRAASVARAARWPGGRPRRLTPNWSGWPPTSFSATKRL